MVKRELPISSTYNLLVECICLGVIPLCTCSRAFCCCHMYISRNICSLPRIQGTNINRNRIPICNTLCIHLFFLSRKIKIISNKKIKVCMLRRTWHDRTGLHLVCSRLDLDKRWHDMTCLHLVCSWIDWDKCQWYKIVIWKGK